MLDAFFQQSAFGIPETTKRMLLLAELQRLMNHHRDACPAYRRLLEVLWHQIEIPDVIEEVPWLPVGIFKGHELVSVPPEQIFRVLTSSGTTGQQVSRIFLDRATAQMQARALAHVMTALLGPDRIPMMIVDSKALLSTRDRLSARAAGVLGMMQFGRSHCYLLDDQMQLDRKVLDAFLASYGDKPFFIFGFTFMVWKYLLGSIQYSPVNLSQGILVHGGGWKALQDEAVSPEVFRATFRDITGLDKIRSFYGMVEQVGSVFLEGHDGLLCTPGFAEVVVRDPNTLEPLSDGETGLLEVLSVLPESYPGHALLTEDLGVIKGRGFNGEWHGTRFEVIGRVPKADLRGCSDTHAVGVH